MKDREVILDVLGRVARRLWVKRALQEIGFGLSVVLFSLVAFELVRPAFPGGGSSALLASAIAVAAVGCAAYTLWRAARRATLAQAAGAADRLERLKDELKTAYWLATHDEVSAFARLQIERAARTAQRLDPGRLVPTQALAGFWIAGVLALLLAVTSSLAPRLSLSSDSLQLHPAEAPASPRALLQGAPEDTALHRLDQALAALERPDASPQQLQQAIAQARDAVDEANLRAVAARESVARVAAAMRGRKELEEAADLLEKGRTAEAVEMLRALAQGSSAERPGEGAPGQPEAGRAGVEGERAVEELNRELRQLSARLNPDALDKAVRSIEGAQNAFEAQRRANEVARRMDDFLVATSQRGALTASRFGSRATAPNPTAAPQTGNTELRGGTMYRQAAVARGDKDDSSEGSRTGAASGHSQALEPEGERTERLAAKLTLEALREQGAAEDGREPEGQRTWYYQPTQGGEAKTAFARIGGRGRYADALGMNADRVPLQSRQSVRSYFIDIHESAGK